MQRFKEYLQDMVAGFFGALPFMCAGVLMVGLAACGDMTTREVRVQAPNVPRELRTCKDAPQAPKGGSQKTAAAYVVGLGGAYADCKGKLGQVNKLLTNVEAAR